MAISRESFQQAIALLRPRLQDEHERRAYLMMALGINAPVLHRLVWNTPVNFFTTNMVKELLDFGEIAPGQPALCALLEVIREDVGVDIKDKINELLRRIKEELKRPDISEFEFDVVTVNARGKEINRQCRKANFFSEDLGNGIVLEMVSIPGNTFFMGSPDTEKEQLNSEGPRHQVTVPPFSMGKFPVTQAQWQAVAALPKINRTLEADPSGFKGANRPVEQVSWHNAMEFCARLSQRTERAYRLPSEAEWEYACRAGTNTPFHFGETITTDLANYAGNVIYSSEPKGKNRQETTPVGSFRANAFGLYDMHGNVWEWCADTWHKTYQGAPNDGSVWQELSDNDNYNHSIRGGSWCNYPRGCRSAYRVSSAPDVADFNIGFRVVCVVPRTF